MSALALPHYSHSADTDFHQNSTVFTKHHIYKTLQ